MKQGKVIGLIGGAGSGKSEVLRILRSQYGAVVILADDVARSLQEPGKESYVKIVEVFGNPILCADGSIDRPKLADLVFHDKEALNCLNGIVHPDVRKEIERQIAAFKEEIRTGERANTLIILEAALLVECGYRSICDAFWYVHTREAIRRIRLKETRGYSDEKITAVIANQLSEEEFYVHADLVIENNSSVEELEKELEQIMFLEGFEKI